MYSMEYLGCKKLILDIPSRKLQCQFDGHCCRIEFTSRGAAEAEIHDGTTGYVEHITNCTGQLRTAGHRRRLSTLLQVWNYPQFERLWPQNGDSWYISRTFINSSALPSRGQKPWKRLSICRFVYFSQAEISCLLQFVRLLNFVCLFSSYRSQLKSSLCQTSCTGWNQS